VGHYNNMTRLIRRRVGRENVMTKEELRIMGTTNKKKERSKTIVSLGRLMESMGIANRKKRERGTTVLSRRLMGTMVTYPGWEEVDKRRHPRMSTYHPLIFQN